MKTLSPLTASLGLALAALGQGVPELPDSSPGTPETPTETAARLAAYQATLSSNRVRFEPWLVSPLTLSDGSAANRDSMDAAIRTQLLSLSEDFASRNATMLTQMQQQGLSSVVTLPAGGLKAEARLEGGKVYFLMDDSVQGADTISSDELWPSGATGLNLDGTNTIVGLWEAGGIPLSSHTEYSGRVSIRDGTTTATSHATGVASVMASTGVANPVFGGITYTNGAKGMSFRATVHAHDTLNDYAEMTGAASTNSLRHSNHSYSVTCGWRWLGSAWAWYGDTNVSQTDDWKFGAYTVQSQSIDDTIYTAQNYLPVWTPGNSRGEGPTSQPVAHYVIVNGSFVPVTNNIPTRSLDGDAGGYDSIHPNGTAKNTLTVGAANAIAGGYAGPSSVTLGSFSPYGPTDDGRIKPDVVAMGVNVVMAHNTSNGSYQRTSGTSFAAPAVTGSLNLLEQHRASLHPTWRAPLASTKKGLVIHTADEAGDHLGPDYRFGWGLMNTRTAASLLSLNATNGWKTFIKEISLENGDYVEFPVAAVGGTNALKVTLCWTDPAGAEQSSNVVDEQTARLANDLDLRVYSPTGATNFPWVLNPDLTNQSATARAAAATKADNTRDNVEQVVITNATTSGAYVVRVTHKGTLQNGQPQWLSLLLSGVNGQAKPGLAIVDSALTATNKLAFQWPSVPGQLYQVQWRQNITATNWTNVGGEISATKTNAAAEFEFSSSQTNGFFRIAEVE